MVEPLIYDFVDITRQQYQNTFSEVLRVFARAIRRCTPYRERIELAQLMN